MRIDHPKLKLILARRGLEQQELASRIGKRPETLSAALRKHTYTDADVLLIANTLNVAIDDIIEPDTLDALKPRHGVFAVELMKSLRDIAAMLARAGRTLDVEGAAEGALLEHEAALLDMSRKLRSGDLPCTREAVARAHAAYIDTIIRGIGQRIEAGEHDAAAV